MPAVAPELITALRARIRRDGAKAVAYDSTLGRVTLYRALQGSAAPYTIQKLTELLNPWKDPSSGDIMVDAWRGFLRAAGHEDWQSRPIPAEYSRQN